ncbi:hypothetical protein N656DRAFT_638383 [Canariomyces notabilis]|uniref:Uncharacterized protein n=1 Tax=Canariomyces notabilis TaxID=2074819 RepID=A0AAN6TEM8_9PEZI|nr:hypothetical protein N656DRAFT_638383 [Canariomyces arenarius]
MMDGFIGELDTAMKGGSMLIEELVTAMKGGWNFSQPDPSSWVHDVDSTTADVENTSTKRAGEDTYRDLPVILRQDEEGGPLSSEAASTSPSLLASTPEPFTIIKQVGVANIQLRLTLSPNTTLRLQQRAEDDDQCTSSDSSSEETNDADYDAQDPAGGHGNSQFNGASERVQEDPVKGAGQADSGASGGNGRDSHDRDNEPREQKRRKLRRAGSNRPRLACPYQVFEAATLDCFQRGPRNPHGGCEDIYRLRQHLARRHMPSRRCMRCWKSFESPNMAREHEQQSGCEDRLLPDLSA